MNPPLPRDDKACNCRKSNCLKLYCECFGANSLCTLRCNCMSCHNKNEHAQERTQAISATLERNPSAFRPRHLPGATGTQKGCHCKKSNCLKKYCECFQLDARCTEQCRCKECENIESRSSKNLKSTQQSESIPLLPVYIPSWEIIAQIDQEMADTLEGDVSSLLYFSQSQQSFQSTQQYPQASEVLQSITTTVLTIERVKDICDQLAYNLPKYIPKPQPKIRQRKRSLSVVAAATTDHDSVLNNTDLEQNNSAHILGKALLNIMGLSEQDNHN